MPDPIKPIKTAAKAIQGGVQGVKNTAAAVKMNNANVKAGTAVAGVGPGGQALPAPKKQTMGPLNAARSFAAGAANPKAAKDTAAALKSMQPAKPAKKG